VIDYLSSAYNSSKFAVYDWAISVDRAWSIWISRCKWYPLFAKKGEKPVVSEGILL